MRDLFRTFYQEIHAKRHNFNIHNGRSEIVPFIEYMVGRSSGRYWQAIHHGFASRKDLNGIASYPSDNRVIADSSFRPETLVQPYPVRYPIHRLQRFNKN